MAARVVPVMDHQFPPDDDSEFDVSITDSDVLHQIDTFIHQAEMQAYASVLRAFVYKTNNLNQEKQNLIISLINELEITSDEHNELLDEVKNDEMVHLVREWKSFDNYSPERPIKSPSPTVSASQQDQPLKPAKAASLDPLIGKKVSTKLPEPDKQIYDAGITDYDPAKLPTQTEHDNLVVVRTFSDLSTNPEDEEFPECDWSEHYCPDGNKYYYNSVTCESTWEKPEEYDKESPKQHKQDDHSIPCPQLLLSSSQEVSQRQQGKYKVVYDANTPNEFCQWIDLKKLLPDDIQWEGNDHTCVPCSSEQNGQDNDSNNTTGKKDKQTQVNEISSLPDTSDGNNEKVKMHTKKSTICTQTFMRPARPKSKSKAELQE